MNALLLLLAFIGQDGPYASRLKDGEVLRTSTVYQVVDPSGTSWVEIQHQTEMTPRKGNETTTIFTMPSGEKFVLRQRFSYSPATIEDTFQFPDHQSLSLIGRTDSKAPDATSTTAARPGLPTEGTLTFGKHQLKVDLGQDAEGEFTSKEGRAFRNKLPALPEDLIEVLSNLKNEDLCLTLALCGPASTFFEAYRDGWIKEKDNAWELKRIGVAKARETPIPGRTKSETQRPE
ncbi:MAG TPA: hypothetical protein VK571_00460 [Gemmatimonadaceae bacterium]|nr:hypothetical protein [Gemmatimonadaceae bacterium]